MGEDIREYLGQNVLLVCSAVVLDNSNRIVMVQSGEEKYYGKWGLPGGNVEKFEDLENAIEREITEETGMDAELLYIIGIYLGRSERGHAIFNVSYAAKGIGPIRNENPDPNEKVLEVRPFSIDALPKPNEQKTKDTTYILEDFIRIVHGKRTPTPLSAIRFTNIGDFSDPM